MDWLNKLNADVYIGLIVLITLWAWGSYYWFVVRGNEKAASNARTISSWHGPEKNPPPPDNLIRPTIPPSAPREVRYPQTEAEATHVKLDKIIALLEAQQRRDFLASNKTVVGKAKVPKS